MALVLDLKKSLEINLDKAGILDVPPLEVRLAVDKSTSMRDLYRSGWVSCTVDRLIAAAMRFDDNGELEVGFFDESFWPAPPATQEDAGRYMDAKASSVRADGGTHYEPILRAMDSSLSAPVESRGGLLEKIGRMLGVSGGSDARRSRSRAYLCVITDGDNQDQAALEERLARCSGDTFIQFVAIGTQVSERYLRSLARRYPFVSVFFLPNPTLVSDDEFYQHVCNPQLADWIEATRRIG